jgi:hypothetical protein
MRGQKLLAHVRNRICLHLKTVLLVFVCHAVKEVHGFPRQDE